MTVSQALCTKLQASTYSSLTANAVNMNIRFRSIICRPQTRLMDNTQRIISMRRPQQSIPIHRAYYRCVLVMLINMLVMLPYNVWWPIHRSPWFAEVTANGDCKRRRDNPGNCMVCDYMCWFSLWSSVGNLWHKKRRWHTAKSRQDHIEQVARV